MRTGTVSYKLEDLKKGVIIPIGFEGENDFTRVIFDAKEVYKNYPNAIVSMKVQPPEGAPYPATVIKEENNVIWQVKAADVANRGGGELQLTFTEGETVIKTYIARTDIKRSLKGNGPAPDPVQDWIDQASEMLEEADHAIEEAESAAQHAPIIGLDGYWYRWDAEAEEYVTTGTKAQGEDGEDGHSPELTAEKVDKTTTIYADGQQLAQIMDGEDGQGADVIDDTAGEGDTDKTWSADKLEEETTELKNAIQGKPDEKNSTAANVDLDITDNDGNVIARFSNGNFSVKKFDSAKAPSTSAVDTDSNSDFVIADPAGNVVLMIHNGNIETKNFKSVSIKPNIITVKKNGQGDFTNLRDAVESIADADPISNPYVIEIYEGQYNVLEDYTDEEIESAGEAHYTDTSFVGIKITDGISLRGVGCRDNIILYGYLNPSDFTQANRNNIATINTQGECSLENLTIIGENIRYAVHDDFNDNFRTLNGRNPKRIIKDCVFIAKNTTGLASYGAGASKARDYYFKDTFFYGGGCGIHKATSMPHSGTMVFENCGGYGLTIGDYSTSAADAIHLLVIDSCDFDTISIYKSNNGSYTGQHIKTNGASKEECFINVPDGFVYKFGNVDTTDQIISTGGAVNINYGQATNKYNFYGICIGNKDGLYYVQTSGFVKNALVGLSAVAGDYIGVSNGTLTVVNDPSDAIGIVVSNNSTLYVKMM